MIRPGAQAKAKVLVAIVLWAGNVIASRLSAHTIGPQAITFYRLLLAVALMSLFVARPAWRNRAGVRKSSAAGIHLAAITHKMARSSQKFSL